MCKEVSICRTVPFPNGGGICAAALDDVAERERPGVRQLIDRGGSSSYCEENQISLRF